MNYLQDFIIIIITFKMFDRLYPTHCSHNLRSLCFTKHLKRNAFYINLEENEQK